MAETKPVDHRLPLRELQKTKDYYQRSLTNLKEFFEETKNFIEKFRIPLGGSTAEWRYKLAKARVELDETEAKIDVQQYHLQVYNDRVEAYMPTFEKESAQTNKEWEETWKIASGFAARYPLSVLAQVMQNFPKDGMGNQELKNETFKVLKKQIEHFQQLPAGKAPMKVS